MFYNGQIQKISRTKHSLRSAIARVSKDGFGSDTDEIGSECHLLPHFNSDTNTKRIV